MILMIELIPLLLVILGFGVVFYLIGWLKGRKDGIWEERVKLGLELKKEKKVN